tara:strand:- start:5947 stop:6387 length:441 start_codon:yes stop_codon:yes gene_type:complete
MIVPLLSNAQEDSQSEERQQMYLSHLEEEGYRPTIDDDGDVKFKKEGKSYYIFDGPEKTFKIATYLALDEDQECSEELRWLINKYNKGRIIESAIIFENCQTVGLYSSSHLARDDDWERIYQKATLWLKYASDDFFDQYAEWKEDK